MDISVIVPFHNEEKHIERCIGALRSQNYPRNRYEIVMIDNGSTDGSAGIVRRYSDVRLLSESTPGSYAARNRGVAETTGKILAFTDSDCSPNPDWLSTICRELSAPGVRLVLGRQRFGVESPSLALLEDYDAAKAAFVFSSGRSQIYYGYTNNLAVHRSTFLTAGPFQKWMRGADVIFVHRIVDEYSPAAIKYSPDMCIVHWEIDTVGTWLRKMRIYGRSFRRYGDVAHCRPLSSTDRRRVLEATIRQGRYPWYRSAWLIALLSAGVVAYESGRRFPRSS
jgi:glycosyltransferase involved in cell wall biosynthesis